MEEYKGNSHKMRNDAETKQIHTKTVGKPVVGAKQSGGIKSFFETFVEHDAKDIWDYAKYEVIVPGIKEAIASVIDMALFDGGYSRGRGRGSSYRRGPVDYGRYSDGRSSRSRRDYDDRDRDRDKERERGYRRNRYGVKEIPIEGGGRAFDDVKRELEEELERYNFVDIATFHSTLGDEETPEHTDFSYGWRDLRGMDYEHRRVNGKSCIVIHMPRPVPED